jgi:hypothetical protein
MKKQRITQGSILEINIDNQYYAYAQILDKSEYAFFDYKSEKQLNDLSILESKPILFMVGVYDDVVTKGHWLKVGKLEIRESLKVLPMQFIQDALHPDRFEFYNPNTGEITPATKEKVKNLERASVWEANHVEDRIRDYYNGVPCIWLEEDIELFKN